MRWLSGFVLLVGCGHRPPESSASALPPSLVGRAVVLSPADPDYARAGLGDAVKPPGQGGLSEGVVVRLTADVPVYRLWSGPEVVDAGGHTNRLGQWWASDAPTGTQDAYRARYEVCRSWNALDWLARCTLEAGAVIAVGPGQSVDAALCGEGESYPANHADWQVFVASAWSRPELECPEPTADRQVDPSDLSR